MVIVFMKAIGSKAPRAKGYRAADEMVDAYRGKGCDYWRCLTGLSVS